MEDVRRVVRAEVMFHIGQQARGCIAGRLDHLTGQTRQRLCHERLPRVVSAALGRWLQEDVVALGCHRHQTKPAGKRFILGHGEGFGGHVPGQQRAFLAAVRHDRLLHLAVDLVLGPIRRADKPIKAREWQEPAHQTHATRPHCGAHQRDPENQAMPEGQPRATVTKGDNGGRLVEALWVGPPGLKRAAGHLKCLGRLT
jgi:hypothetical protein